MLDIDEIHRAARRIAPYIRTTPMLAAGATRQGITEADLWFKLECLQPTGSFKVRGATNKWLTTPLAQLGRGIVTASGGNHGLATARAASLAGVPATIFVPTTISPAKLAKLQAWGADVRTVGSVWDQANLQALAFAKSSGGAYFHPFADPAVVAGQATIGLEIVQQLPDVDVVLVAIGGGGLVSGICSALRAVKPGTRVIGIEPTGAPTLHASIAAGEVVTLPEVTTRVATMACARTDPGIFALVREAVDHIVLVSDESMLEAARWLWFEFGLAADLSGAAAVAALQSGVLALPAGTKACALVCGAGADGVM